MIQSTLRLGLLQADLIWNDVAANLRAFENQLDAHDQAVDLFILPEMFSTGFCMEPSQVAASAGEETFDWLLRMANKRQVGFCGSVAYKLAAGKFVNRMFLVDADGSFTHYDKRHRFAMAGEDIAYAAGNRKPVIAMFRGWKILLQVCYDLRFPVYSRNKVGGYDAVIYVANWPTPRRLHWRTLLAARAIENQAYSIGVNRIGMDVNGLAYSGDSMVIDALGQPLLDMVNTSGCGSVLIDYNSLKETRIRLPFLSDADGYTLRD